MRQVIKCAGIMAAVTLTIGLAMCIGGGVSLCGWVLGYMGALALVSVCGFAAAVTEHE